MIVGAMKHIVVPVKVEILMLTQIASSIDATSISGINRDLKTIATRMNIASIEIAPVTTKSFSATVIRSLVRTPSPVSIPPSSYFLTIEVIFSICAFSSSVAAE